MKRLGILVLAVALMVSGLFGTVGNVMAADNAYDSGYFTAVTYQNVGDASTTVTFDFYVAGSSSPISIDRELAAGASASLNVSTTDEVTAGFQGSAVASSDQPVVATMVQICADEGCPVVNRPLSNGMTADQGASTVLIATALKNQFNQTTKFSVQNVGSDALNADVNFYAVGSATPAHTESISNLPAGSAQYFDLGTITALGDSFNGSVSIEADGTGTAVAAALELGTGGGKAYYANSFEGVTSGSTTVYMPSAMCDAFGTQRTAYAIQNNSGAEIAAGGITITFTDKDDATKTYTYSNPEAIAAGGKWSAQTCNADGMEAGFNGSAEIVSSGEIVAIDKVFQNVSIGGLSSAFLGAASGDAKLALPYVRWATDENYSTTPVNRFFTQRTYIAIQNVGDSEIPAGSITIKYVDEAGTERGTHTIDTAVASGAKVNTNASMADMTAFGYKGDNGQAATGGGALIECSAANCQLIATARIASNDATTNALVGEDYNGIPVE